MCTIGIFIFHPTIPNYPNASFPGVVVFSEIYQGNVGPLRTHSPHSINIFFSSLNAKANFILFYLSFFISPFSSLFFLSFIFYLRFVNYVCVPTNIVTGPVKRFARQIAGHGYIVVAPSSYHEFTGPEPLAYDVPGTDAGNNWKVEKVSTIKLLTYLLFFICLLPPPQKKILFFLYHHRSYFQTFQIWASLFSLFSK